MGNLDDLMQAVSQGKMSCDFVAEWFIFTVYILFKINKHFKNIKF